MFEPFKCENSYFSIKSYIFPIDNSINRNENAILITYCPLISNQMLIRVKTFQIFQLSQYFCISLLLFKLKPKELFLILNQCLKKYKKI